MSQRGGRGRGGNRGRGRGGGGAGAAAPGGGGAGTHTIILIQPENAKSSRTFRDYQTKARAMDDLVRMYEARLKQLNPSVPDLTYDVSDLFKYLDSMADISMLTLETSAGMYKPHPREEVKRQLYEHLKRQAGG
eukprot:gb/GECG01000669.1/.p1 GENE.gb/GECG01000669.1/~~gb/GECG01000669.1/.p1  ORF type:complete len:134 (+),score=15.26 gb/GECG01000669.1/:1-402(+)